MITCKLHFTVGRNSEEILEGVVCLFVNIIHYCLSDNSWIVISTYKDSIVHSPEAWYRSECLLEPCCHAKCLVPS